MMKRTVMRYRANHSGQAWPGQAMGVVSPRGLLQRFLQASISSLNTIRAPEAARPIRSVPHAHHFRALQILIQDRAGNQYP
jgi:hypothetical protein